MNTCAKFHAFITLQAIFTPIALTIAIVLTKPEKFVMGKPSQNNGVPVTEVWCHKILLAARRERAHPTLTQASPAGRLLDLPTPQGRKAELT